MQSAKYIRSPLWRHAISRWGDNLDSRRIAAASVSRSASRLYHQTTPLGRPYKNDQDRESLKPKSTESTRSGTNEEAARTKAAFDPKNTRPETEKEQAGKEKQPNPLEISPASQEVSKPQGNHGKAG